MVRLDILLTRLESFGLTDIVLPFFLIFAVIYLATAKLPDVKNKMRMVLSAICGLLVVIPHVLGRYPPCWDVVVLINNSIPKIAILGIAAMTFLIVLGIIGVGMGFLESINQWIAVGVLTYVVFAFMTSGGRGCFSLNLLGIPYLDILIPLAVFLALVWYASSGGKSSGPPPPRSIYP